MSVYMTEEEQIEALKKWWKKYSNAVIVSISLLLLLIAGFKYWSWHMENTKLMASNTYERMMLSFSNKEPEKVRTYANQLTKDYRGTIYADSAHLTLAKQYMDENKTQSAQAELSKVAQQGSIPAMQQVAKIRLARILLSQQKYNQALQEIKKISDTSFNPMINELRGDIFAATGKYPQAFSSYKKAMTATQSQGIGNLFLELKANHLAAMTHSLSHRQHENQTA